MKKLLIAAILSIGFFSVTNAQTLNYRLDNQSSNGWSFTIDHAGTAASAVENNIAPGDVRTGTIGGGGTTFALPIEMTAVDSNGCNGSLITDNPGAGSIPFVCTQTSSASYRLTENVPFVLYTLQVRFN